MKVRLMGGPAMNKRVELSDNVMRDGRYYVSYGDPMRAAWNPAVAASPMTTISIKQGYYKPTKNPEIWSWAGPKMVVDPWKSYERKVRKWEREVGKLLGILPPDAVLNMVGPRPERPRV